MPASIATKSNGEAALWLNGKPAWHKLGYVHDVEKDGPVTADFVLQQSGLGTWTVEKRPTFFGDSADATYGTQPQTLGQSWATVRVNDDGSQVHLGTVGGQYTPFQNSSLIDFLRVVTGQPDTYLETVGELAHGSTVFASMLLGDDIVLDGEGAADTVKRYLMIKNSHNGLGKIIGAVSPVRPVCTNTVSWALQRAVSRWEIKHTTGVMDRVGEAAETLKLSQAYYAQFEIDANELYGMKMNAGQFDRFVAEQVLPLGKDATDLQRRRNTERRDLAHHLFTEAPTNTVLPMNRWRGAMALTELIDHHPTSGERVPKVLKTIDNKMSVSDDAVKGFHIINGTKDDEKTKIHAKLLTWKR